MLNSNKEKHPLLICTWAKTWGLTQYDHIHSPIVNVCKMETA
jgi:hypothetical protein